MDIRSMRIFCRAQKNNREVSDIVRLIGNFTSPEATITPSILVIDGLVAEFASIRRRCRTKSNKVH